LLTRLRAVGFLTGYRRASDNVPTPSLCAKIHGRGKAFPVNRTGVARKQREKFSDFNMRCRMN
jgi:hypothetical protein